MYKRILFGGAMKSIQLLLAVLLISSSLMGQNSPKPIHLKVGNEWTYIEDDCFGYEDYRTYKIVDSGIVINNKSYYKLSCLELSWGRPSYSYIRYDSTDGCYKELENSGRFENGEYKYYKVNTNVGDVWTDKYLLGSRPYYYHVVEEIYKVMFFNRECLYRFIASTDSSVVPRGEWWTEEFGVVKFTTDCSALYLKGCVIDGIMYGDTTTVGVEKEISGDVKEYSLSQNYPNPFNPSTVIRYQIPHAGRVTLKVYDLLGREAASLVDEFKEQGRYEAVFNASALSSGTYIYRIKVNDYSSAKKMQLIR